MINRCENPNASYFKHYGGRGIKVCDRWRYGENGMSGFECFLADMGARPSMMHSIDRINNDGNYEPGNCRWATGQEQAVNRRIIRLSSGRYGSVDVNGSHEKSDKPRRRAAVKLAA